MVLGGLLIVQGFLIALTLLVAQVIAGHAARSASHFHEARSTVPKPWRGRARVVRSQSAAIEVQLASPMVIPGIPIIRITARAGRQSI